MRVHSDQLLEVLEYSFERRWLADLYYDGERKVADLPIIDPKFDDDGGALVQSTGSVTVIYQGDFADSLSPTTVSDLLAPAGAELAVYCIVSAGDFTERVEMGWYRIVETPSAKDFTAKYGSRRITLGSRVELTLQDRFHRVQRDRFDVPGSPAKLTSVFAEVAKQTQLQLTKMVPDKPIPRSIAFEEDRLEYVYDLVAVLGAVPYMRPDGSLGQRTITWPAPGPVLRGGNGGSLISLARSLSSEAVYNRVAFRSTAGDQTSIVATAEITQGPLRVRNADGSPSPAGRVTYYASSEFVTSRTQAQAYVNDLLPRVSTMQALEVPVVEKFNPLREVGDVVPIEHPTGDLLGRVRTISRDSGATQALTLEVNP
ncbi:hypothetical protein EDF38_1313 [Frigoribacterium sp. PhB160]|uniref:hypothetical protein n=1 Tax=Frigoribacterium sp. PhB160 TaxID=2485192 RepID=UPI000F46A776|nr:hypothetical protein [Frigoribacterium sp. PhB160]ROS62210.1 hypothetical protein EDF38_1313 [Frigoribacterium sp. PhB160]